MIKLKVSKQRVEDLFRTVPHKLFQRTKNIWWKVREDGTVTARSALWFFCWAYNGDNSPKAEIACEEIWHEIMPISYAQFDATVGYDYSERFRYSPDEEFIEKEVGELLAK